MAKRTGRVKPSPGRKESKAPIELYPSARLLSIEKPAKDIETIESISEDEWTTVLAFYEKLLPEQGWEAFEAHRFADRGTLSFRHPERGTVTVLAAREADATHIRIYLRT